jgi:hypothetical protein
LKPYTAKPRAAANCIPAVSAACASGDSSSACRHPHTWHSTAQHTAG